jgi:hypothetical protein
LYGLQVEPKNEPWPDCSNLVVPIVRSKLDTLWAQVCSQVFVPEFYIVNGNTEDAAEHAYEVQRWLNAEFRRQRGRSTWFNEHVKWLGLSMRDGTAVMEAMWKYRTRRARYIMQQPKTDDDDGLPFIDQDTGEPMMESVARTKDVIDYNDVNLRPILLRDFMLIPDESTSIEDAAGVARCEWLYENQLKAMVKEGLLNAHWVEMALAYVPSGVSDVTADRQGVYDKTANEQLNIGQGQGAVTSEFFANRGPIKVWRIHTNQFDMNGDGWVEENVFWLHELSNYLLGWCPDEYISPTRPFFDFAPFPDFDRFYGYPLPILLAPSQAEASTIRNQRNDASDISIAPPLLVNRNEETFDKGALWKPRAQWPVSDVNTAVRELSITPPHAQSYQEELLVGQYADQISGLSAPTDGAPTASRRTATEIKMKNAATSVRASLISMLFRVACCSVAQFVFKLKQQYPPTDNTRLTVPPEILGLDYQVSVAGMNDPLNIDDNIQEALALYQLLMKDPDIAQDATARYNLKKNLLSATHTRNIEAIIGTEEEAEQRKQQEEQAKQMQMAMAAQQMQQGGQPGAPQNGKPPGPPGAGPAGPPQGAPAPQPAALGGP